MITLNAYLNFFVGVALVVFDLLPSTTARADGATFRFSLHPPKIEAGERAVLEIRVPKTEKSDMTARLDDSLLTQASTFVLLHSEQKEENGELVWRYDLTSYKPGEFTVPPLAVRYGPNAFSTERQSLQVVSKRQNADEDLREDYPSMWMPFPWFKLLTLLAILGGFFLGSRYLAKRIIRFPWRRYLPKTKLTSSGPTIDPLFWLKKELTRLQTRAQNEPTNEELVDDLTWTLRRYLFLKYAEPFHSRTTKEFEETLRRHVALAPLLEPFRKMDQFKFSGIKNTTPQALLLNGIQTAEKTLCGT